MAAHSVCLWRGSRACSTLRPRRAVGRNSAAYSADDARHKGFTPRATERNLCYRYNMKTKNLTQVLERVEAWPPDAQDALAEIARDIDESISKGDYVPTPAELAGIDRGLRDAEQGRFAPDEQVDAAFSRLRGA